MSSFDANQNDIKRTKTPVNFGGWISPSFFHIKQEQEQEQWRQQQEQQEQWRQQQEQQRRQQEQQEQRRQKQQEQYKQLFQQSRYELMSSCKFMSQNNNNNNKELQTILE